MNRKKSDDITTPALFQKGTLTADEGRNPLVKGVNGLCTLDKRKVTKKRSKA